MDFMDIHAHGSSIARRPRICWSSSTRSSPKAASAGPPSGSTSRSRRSAMRWRGCASCSTIRCSSAQGRTLVPTPLTERAGRSAAPGRCRLWTACRGGGRFDPATIGDELHRRHARPDGGTDAAAMMRPLARDGHGIDLRTVQVRRRSIESGLSDGTLDAASMSPCRCPKRSHRQRVSADRFVGGGAARAIRRAHRASRCDRISPQKHVMVTSRRRGPGAEDIELGQRGQRRHVRLRCRNYLAAFRMVAASDLVAHHAGALCAAAGGGSAAVRALALPLRGCRRSIFYLYWHDRADDDPANRWLRGLVMDAFRTG